MRSDNHVRVSVCMAAYNGERYIVEQMKSILSQLSEEDELVIVDDASTDRTREYITEVSDSRVHLLINDRNRGVQTSFERAFLSCSGEFILLSDQDDVWKHEKVSAILDAFKRDPELMLVLSDSAVINEEGKVIANSYYSTLPKFTTGIVANIIHCRYHGCSMALRRVLLSDVLPLPRGYDVLHDIWIGMRTRIAQKKTLYLQQPLFLYRRHSSNASHRLSKSRQIKVRIHLVIALLVDGIRRSLNHQKKDINNA